MTRLTHGAVVGAIILQVATLVAQTPDMSGTWALDASRSHMEPTAGLAGLIGAGAPDRLYVTQAANGTVIIESRINEGHARLYKPNAKTATPVTVGPAGSITMTSRWEGRTLVSEGTQESASGPSVIIKDVKEIISLAPDARTLTIEVKTTRSGETSASTLVYTRTQVVEPCQAWPTPCKR